MPELPEVETTCRGISPYLIGNNFTKIKVFQRQMRWPIPKQIEALEGATVRDVSRRGKYIQLHTDTGEAIIHLGMSGSLRITDTEDSRRKHDHVEWHMNTGHILRLHDPRRFGCVLWHAVQTPTHPLLEKLGPEPLGNAFTAEYFYEQTRKRKTAIKVFIMNSHIVVGVGNIYASESLFMAGIRPGRAAGRITRDESERLVTAIKSVLAKSIKQGGTTLRDFVNSDGEPGYFKQQLLAYDRAGEPCRLCKHPIKQKVMAQRSTYYCSKCQN